MIGRIQPPPGLPLAKNVDLARMKNEIPSEAEVEAAVRRLRPHRAGRHTNLRAEHFKQCQQEAYPGEQLKTPPTEGTMDVHGIPST